MNSPQLLNYLLSNRKRLALSQTEVAGLIGAESGERVCRHERFQREPSLADALAYEVIYQRSASELFSGLYQQIEREVAARAKLLTKKTIGTKPTRRTAHKREILAGIASKEFTKTF